MRYFTLLLIVVVVNVALYNLSNKKSKKAYYFLCGYFCTFPLASYATKR